MRPCLSSFRREESGFTLVELAVGLAVGLFLIVMTVSFLMKTLGIIEELKIARDIRDQGIFAVQTIEREFRRTLEYGGNLRGLTNQMVKAEASGYIVSINKNGNKFELTIDNGTLETKAFPNGDLVCSSFTVKALVTVDDPDDPDPSVRIDRYVDGSDPYAYMARVIVVEFELEDDEHGISRLFKAAFASAAATGG